MPIDLPAVTVFVAVTTLTPGPNTILSASLGAMHGYRRAAPFMLGVTAGFLVIMLLCATLAASLATHLAQVAPALRLVGAACILWLALGVYRSGRTLLDETGATPPISFWKGCLLQFLNPKAIFFGLTVYAAFLAPLADRPWILVATAPLLAAVALATVSIWAVAGHVIRARVTTAARARVLGVVLAAALVWTAVDLSGLWPG